MSKHSKKEFADLCGIKTKVLSVYIGRAQVIVDDDGQIDDTNAVNGLFLANRKKSVRKEPRVKKEKQEKHPSALSEKIDSKLNLDIVKRQNEIDLQTIEIQKKRGELVPVEGIRSLLIVHSEAIKTAYIDGSESLLLRISQRKQLTNSESVELRKELAEIVNKAIDESISASKKTLLSVTQDFMRKRGVGQHD